ncbi:hypothetical protein FRC08_018343 [Ceratobasidium sp. 394]|nr:hypothetical protein FRC08_018343 [Ceratobasidium sp. 394]
MSPIRVLRLQNVWIPAESSVYTDLVELSLISTDNMRLWTRKQMAQILSSCPGLRWLSLKNVYPGEDSSPIGPIHLKQLQRVELVCDDPNRLAPLLQLLRLEGPGLAIKVDICKEPKFVEQFRAFIGRCSNIAALSVRPKDGKAWFAPLRHGLSRLPMLTLEHCDFEDPDLVQYEETRPGLAVPWPCLRNLRLEHCIIQLDLLDFLTGSRYLERLVLVQCKVRNPHSEDPIPVVLSEIARQLAHSDIVITVDNGAEN